MMFLRLFSAEIRKLREPVTLLTLVGGPGLAGVLLFLGNLTRRSPMAWERLTPDLVQFWLILLLPFSIVAFAAFAAQVEHRARGWDHVLALPAPKWMVYAAKAAVLCLAGVAMTVLFLLCILAGGAAGGALSPGGPMTGPTRLWALTPALALGLCAGLLMAAIQFWLSQRFRHFIIPVLAGTGGFCVTLAGMMFRQADKTRFWPWGLPQRLYAERGLQDMPDAPDPSVVLAVGAAGGAAALIAAVIHLSRRDMR